MTFTIDVSTDSHQIYSVYTDSSGYYGKTTDFDKYSPCHRTTAAHFLNKGKWNDSRRENILKAAIVMYDKSRSKVKTVQDGGVKVLEGNSVINCGKSVQ